MGEHMNFEDWQVGDIIEKTVESEINSVGYQSTITKVMPATLTLAHRVYSTDETGGDSWMEERYATSHYKWVRRPESENEWVNA